jgi:hypothetical protein
MAAAAEAGCRAAVVMVGVVLMLVVAGLLEGFARQLIQDTFRRLTVGGGCSASGCSISLPMVVNAMVDPRRSDPRRRT